MQTKKRADLKLLFESENGIHLTAYLVNRGDLVDLKYQLKIIINKAYDWLHPVMSLDQRKIFLRPLEALMVDDQALSEIKGNLGIFRKFDLFQTVPIPIHVQESCIVATSFHIKPLLRWLESNQDFLLLEIKRESAHLYLGNQESFSLVKEISFVQFYQKKELLVWLKDCIEDLHLERKIELFVASPKDFSQALDLISDHLKIIHPPVFDLSNQNDLMTLCEEIRKTLYQKSQKVRENELLEFKTADMNSRVQKNIFLIAKSVVRGKVRKLIVTDEVSLFGTIDRKSGGLALHPFDLDHEDDCILDDLAQMVFNQGGRVTVAKRSEIPNGRPILAMLDEEESPEELQMPFDLQARIQ